MLLDPLSSYKLKGLNASLHCLNLSSSNSFCLGCCNSPNLQPASPHYSFISAVLPFSKHRGKSLPYNPWGFLQAGTAHKLSCSSREMDTGHSAEHCTFSALSVPDHRVMEWFGWEGILKITNSNTFCHGQVHLSLQIRIPPLMKTYCFAAAQHGWCFLLLPWLSARSITLLSPKQKCPSLP